MVQQTQQQSGVFLPAEGCDAWWQHSGSPGPCGLECSHRKSWQESSGPGPLLSHLLAFESAASTRLKTNAVKKANFHNISSEHSHHRFQNKNVSHIVSLLTVSWAIVRSRDKDDFAVHFTKWLNISTQRVFSCSYYQNTIFSFDQFQALGQILLQPLRV